MPVTSLHFTRQNYAGRIAKISGDKFSRRNSAARNLRRALASGRPIALATTEAKAKIAADVLSASHHAIVVADATARTVKEINRAIQILPADGIIALSNGGLSMRDLREI